MNIYTAALLLIVGLLIGVVFFVTSKPVATVEACAATSQTATIAASPAKRTTEETASSAAWPVPPTAESAMTVEPVRVFDILASGKLNGSKGGYVLPDGIILFWGDGTEITEEAVSFLNPADGRIETIWQDECVNIRSFFLSAERQVAWFVSNYVSQPDGIFVVDIPRRRVWPAHQLYSREQFALLEKALKDDSYYKIRVGAEGSLMLEWSDVWPIANWWGRSPEYWQMRSVKEEEKVFSRAILPSPEARFQQGMAGPLLSITFDVSFTSSIANERRPEPDPIGRRHAPAADGVCYSELTTFSMPAAGLRVQLFNRYFDPRTMGPCGAGNESSEGDLRVWSSASSSTCARFQGAYVERADDGKLLHVLNHGIGVPEGADVRGRLFAMSGIAEEPVVAKYVSLWDAPEGKLLAHLALPRQAVGYTYPYTVLFSNDAKEVYCLTSYPKPMLFVWQLKPEWAALGKYAALEGTTEDMTGEPTTRFARATEARRRGPLYPQISQITQIALYQLSKRLKREGAMNAKDSMGGAVS